MGEKRTIEAADGIKIDAWQAKPSGTPKAGIVVIQEIFGVNNHIRNVTDRFATDGYLALAPAMFDRRKKGVDLGYTQEGIAQGREIAMSLKADEIRRLVTAQYVWTDVDDVDRQLAAAGHRQPADRVAVVVPISDRTTA